MRREIFDRTIYFSAAPEPFIGMSDDCRCRASQRPYDARRGRIPPRAGLHD
jgi:hypothetical protein